MNLYILKLINNKYYIGTTNKDVIERLQEHINNKGSQWTKKHKVLKLEKSITNCDKYDEDKWTKIYMDKYGIENVRGGSYCEIKLNMESVNTIAREISHANGNCLYCNKKGHYINNCPKMFQINKKTYSKHLNYLNMSCDYESESESESESDYENDYASESDYENDYASESESDENNDEELDEGTYNIGNQYGEWKPIKKKTTTKTNNDGSCYRCGRNSHYSSNCYAKKHIKGYYL